MSKKMIVVILCLIIVLLTLGADNTELEEAQSMLISKMMENERIVQVFSMDDRGVVT